MSQHANLNLIHQWVDLIWNGSNLDQIADFHPPIFDNEGNETTLEETKCWHQNKRATFPDIHYSIDDMFAADDRVALRWTATATHEGTLWDMFPATGKVITWNGIHLLRLDNHKIVEIWALQNTVSQLQQMGVTLNPASKS